MVRTVLVVEDNQIDRTRLVKVLSDAGYEVSTAQNGLQAIDQVKRNKPEAILMDINMPEMDGFAATRARRGDKDTKHIPVILVTGKDQKADKAWGQMLGAKGYVTKPFTDEQLLEQIRLL